jgi:dTDP-glucose pyrophosphorylase
MSFTVLLTTSGLGTRLGELTRYTNKSLVPLGRLPVISHILNGYPRDTHIIVTLGHHGERVMHLLALAHPERRFEFVWVDNYSGPGSSLVHSILCAKDRIDGPFVYHACDTIVPGAVPPPTDNWVGGCVCCDMKDYRTLNVNNGRVTRINEKAAPGGEYAYVGVAGIADWEMFVEEGKKIHDDQRGEQDLSDANIIQKMMARGAGFRCHVFPRWADVGNTDALSRATASLDEEDGHESVVLRKNTEAVFLYDDFVVKFFDSRSCCRKRVARAEILKDVVPAILASRGNFYKYQYVPGPMLSERVTVPLFRRFLEWSRGTLWVWEGQATESSQEAYRGFYFTKTGKRLERFLERSGIADRETVINEVVVPPAMEMVRSLDARWLCNGDRYRIHGDYILDNVVVEGDRGFKLIDWRQDFGGELAWGDIYYDLAKLNHSLTINHRIVADGLFRVDACDGAVRCGVLRPSMLCDCQEIFWQYVRQNGLDESKVRVLTALVWLNMAAMHEPPLSEFLYFFGRYKLHAVLAGCV